MPTLSTIYSGLCYRPAMSQLSFGRIAQSSALCALISSSGTNLNKWHLYVLKIIVLLATRARLSINLVSFTIVRNNQRAVFYKVTHNGHERNNSGPFDVQNQTGNTDRSRFLFSAPCAIIATPRNRTSNP